MKMFSADIGAKVIEAFKKRQAEGAAEEADSPAVRHFEPVEEEPLQPDEIARALEERLIGMAAAVAYPEIYSLDEGKFTPEMRKAFAERLFLDENDEEFQVIERRFGEWAKREEADKAKQRRLKIEDGNVIYDRSLRKVELRYEPLPKADEPDWEPFSESC